MAKKIEYSIVKKALYEAWRVFFPAFALVIFTQFEAGVDLRNWKAWAFTLIGSALLAGVKAVMKWARDEFGGGNYSHIIYKLPL